MPPTVRSAPFRPNCTRCPRLVRYRRDLAKDLPGYHNAPVAPTGPQDAALLVVGLAPGLHGANRTGIPFTGDDSGRLLFEVLDATGFRNRGRLEDCAITNAVKCVPPENRPTGHEVGACAGYLKRELANPHVRAVLALGRIAHDATLRTLGRTLRDFPFAHGARHDLGDGRLLFDSYHCSRYNVNTGRIDAARLADVFTAARDHVRAGAPVT